MKFIYTADGQAINCDEISAILSSGKSRCTVFIKGGGCADVNKSQDELVKELEELK